MSQERLDQTCSIPLGTRDAIHVPFTVGSLHNKFKAGIYKLIPGSFVRFVDDKFIEFELCEREKAHGILNPFLEEISIFDNVVVLLKPGITSVVRHTFDIDPKKEEIEKQILEMELKEAKEEDPSCADCYVIKNNRVTRM